MSRDTLTQNEGMPERNTIQRWESLMGKMFNVQQMIGAFAAVQDEAALYEQIERTTCDLGFRYFAMGHHVDLVGAPTDAIRLCNYDPEWIERALAERFYTEDPVHRASLRVPIGFLWSDVPGLIDITPQQEAILAAARGYGLGAGYTVRVHMPLEYRGSCSFAGPDLNDLADNAIEAAQTAGLHAFTAARRILRRRSRMPEIVERPPVLTERQHDSLVLVAQGKTDREIGMVLGISSRTAHEHVENVRKAYGYAQRPFLVARALDDGQIAPWEVFRH